jgi:hypothetical protein
VRKNLSQSVLIGLALLVLTAGLRAYVHERRLPALGFLWNNTGGVVYAVHRDGPAERAGVRVGDVFLEMESVPVVERDRFQRTLEAVPVGQDVSIVVERDGELQFLVLFTAPMSPRLEGFAVYYWIALIFWVSGVVTYLARDHDRVAVLFLLFCLAATVALFTNTNVNLAFVRWTGALQRVATGLAGAYLLHLALHFPEEKRLCPQVRALLLAFFYGSGLLLGGLNTYFYPRQLQGEFTWLFNVFFLWVPSCFVGWAAGLVHTIRSAAEQRVRQQVREMAAGITLTLLPFAVLLVANVVYNIVYHRTLVDVRLAVTTLLVFPMSLGYAILKQRSTWDVEVLVNRGLVYLSLGAILLFAYFVLVAALGRLWGVAISWGAFVVGALAALIVALLALLLRPTIQAVVYHLFFRRD